MFRFAKPSGEPFDLDYNGTIFAFDSGNNVVAVCHGGNTWFDEAVSSGAIEKVGRFFRIVDPDALENCVGDIGNPLDPDDWNIAIVCGGEKNSDLRHLLVSVYSTLMVLERMIVRTKG